MSQPDAVPARIRWAVDLVDPAPDDRVLEIGCGPGAAAALVAERLTTGHVLAIDRSTAAVERSTARGRAPIEAGRLEVRRATLTDLVVDPDLAGSELRFDTAFAVNVNLFWTSSAEPELAVLRALLGADGSLVLVYDAPGDRAAEIADRVTETVAAHGFTTTARKGPTPSLVAVTATPT